MRKTRFIQLGSLIGLTGTLFSTTVLADDPCISFIANTGAMYNQQTTTTVFGFQIPGQQKLEDPAKACKGDYLCRISLYTYCTLVGVSDLVVNLLQSDKSDFTSNNATNFSTLGAGLAQNTQKQMGADVQNALIGDFFQDGYSQNSANTISQSNVPLTTTLTGTAIGNELTYQTLLGLPYFSTPESYTDPNNSKNSISVNSALKYIENASSLGITHMVPKQSWRGSTDAKDRYIKYFKTITAVQTYNGYILSGLYANYLNNPQNPTSLTTTQLTLMQNASSGDWLTKIATQDIGVVLRQILLFNSQTYVLLAQLLKTQQDLLATQAMTNTLLVTGNFTTEAQLLHAANPDYK